MLARMAPNATAMARSYEDETGRLSQQDQTSGANLFNGFSYDYTDRGNIEAIGETGTIARTRNYSYDELERLTSVESPDAPLNDESYTLDPEGNRLDSHLSATHQTDDANRLTEDDAYSYIYDLNGNLLSKTAKPGIDRPDWDYAYDALDQLISVTRDGIEVERYRYDAFGRRSAIDTIDQAGNFERIAIVNDSSDRTIDLIEVMDGAGASTVQVKNRYSHGGQIDEPLSVEVFNSDGSFDQAYTYHADHLGSIRFITDSVGEIVNTYDYDSYGRPGFTLEFIDQPFRYTGREFDQATELYHYRARQYDPETGRFLQEDPLGFTAGDLNVQRYVGNNPISFTDPSGLVAATETSGTKRGALLASSSQAALGIRVACMFGNIGGLVQTAGLAAGGNLVGASLSGATSISSCGGARVGLTFANSSKATVNAVVDNATAPRFVASVGDILADLAKNDKLKNIARQLFRRGAKHGNGGTADAAIFTKLTGNLVGGSNHLEKVSIAKRSLNKLIASGNLGVRDLAIARTLLKDLQRLTAFTK